MPSYARYLAPRADIVHSPDFEAGCVQAFAALFPRKRKGTKRSKGSISRKTERAQHASPPQIDRHRKRLRDVINTDSVYHRNDVIALQASRCAMRDLDINNKENNSTMPSQRPTIAPTWRAPLAQMNGDPRMLSKIPSEKQVKNRIGCLTNELAKKWKIETYAQLYEWCSLNACTTKNVVFGPAGFDKATDATTFSKISYKFQNDDLLLDTFRHTFKDGQASDDAFAAADGTYKLHHGKWTVVAFGTFRTRFTLDRAYRKKFLPWAFPLVRKEHEYAYARLFRTVAKYTQEFWRSTHGQVREFG
ncbi:hypothetical protein PC129_g17777 [Phytophthora cactorum]|uniref:Uncharacterized protein n=1 Tax=Phytophthora cactorum TaxID=29920 RepID=A0A8T1HIS4_9STRA|nr:hypothetical protein PC129_g17777 [Phytophthora cactorum]